MLTGIDARVALRKASILVRDGSDEVVGIGGRGLVLMPSAYIWPNVVSIVDEPWQPTIVYPARGIADLWQSPTPPPHALVRLIGRTRALLLASLDKPASTGALAGIFGLSPSGISGHMIALRNAGLIAGRRDGHEVRYARTPLGSQLLRGSGPEQPSSRSR
jgi:DNA-binding transcriptional ArsR family regulator